MILEKRTCHRCQSANIVKNGKNTSGTQTFKCKDCGCCRVLDTRQKGRQPDAEEVRRAYVMWNAKACVARPASLA